MLLLRQRLFTLVSVCGQIPQSWLWHVCLLINLNIANLSCLLSFCICVQFQSSCPPFMYTARRLLLSWHGNFTGNKAYPPSVYTTLTHNQSHTSSTSTRRRQSLSTQWKGSSLAHGSRPKLWWWHSSNTLIWPWSRGSTLARKQVLCTITQPLTLKLTSESCDVSWWFDEFPSSARCPPDWLANGRSCYAVIRTGLTWSDAHHSCRNLAAGSHLADLKTLEDLSFMSSHLLSHNNLLLLWTGLNDQQVASLQKHTLYYFYCSVRAVKYELFFQEYLI